MEERQSLQEYFRTLLLTVMGQVLEAAGYTLQEIPMQWAGGLFRFKKTLPDGDITTIEFQVLVYTDSSWSAGMPSRFRVSLSSSQSSGNDKVRTLSALIVEDFGVAILPSADHWWSFQDTDSLGKELAEAGHLLVGYGIPWLSGDLKPPE